MTHPPPAADGPAPNYRLIGSPDLLHDLIREFEEIGWSCSIMRWQAVITACPADASAPSPGWPAEVTLADVSHLPHSDACQDFFGMI